MPEMTLHRMNFLTSKKPSLTYGMMGTMFMGWCAILVVWYGINVFRLQMVKSEIQKTKQKSAALEQEKEKKLTSQEFIETRSISGSAQDELVNIFKSYPQWSEVLETIAASMPPQMSLQTIRTRREEKDLTSEMTIIAIGRTPQVAALFVNALKQSSLFHDPKLIATTQASQSGAQFEFTIQAFVTGDR